MARSPQQESKFGNFLGRLGARYTRWVRSTATTVIYDPPDAHARAVALHPYIFAMWHGQFVLMPTLHEGAFKVSAIAARHRDAAAIRTLLGEFDIEVVVGAGANDRKRDVELFLSGYRVLRFTTGSLVENIDLVVSRIRDAVRLLQEQENV